MPKPLEWQFKIDDKVSGPAAKMAAELDDLIAKMRAVKSASRGMGAGAPPKWMREVGGLRGGGRSTDHALGRQLKALELAAAARGGSASVIIDRHYNAKPPPLPKMPKAPIAARPSPGMGGELASGALDGLGLGMVAGGPAAWAAAAAAAAAGIGVAATAMTAAATKFTLSASMFREKSLEGFGMMTGSAAEGKALFDKALEFSSKFGVQAKDALKQFQGIRGAGFSDKEVPVIFQALQDVKASGGNADGLLGMFDALSNMGKVGARDVKAMAKAAGVDLPTAMDAIAKELGVSQAKVKKILESDAGIDPKLGILGILRSLEKKQGGTLGTFAAKEAATLEKQLAVLGDTFDRIAMGADGARPGFDLFKSVVTGINSHLGPGTAAAGQLEQVFARLDGVLANLFSRWAGPDGMRRLGEDVDAMIGRLERMAAAAELIAKPLGFIFSAGATAAIGSTASTSTGEAIAGHGLRALLPSPIAMALGLLDGSGPKKLPHMAAGGIVDRPTLAVIGEAGPEAVIPKSRWLSPSEGGGGGRSITVAPQITLTVQAGGAEGELQDRVAAAVRAVIVDEFTNIAQQVGAEA